MKTLRNVYMKRSLSLLLILLMLLSVNTFVFALNETVTYSETEEQEKVYPSIGAKYPDLNTGSVNNKDNVIISEAKMDGFDVVKAVVDPSGEHINDIVSLDNYSTNITSLGVALENYKYITVIYKYDGTVQSNSVPQIYIAASTNELKSGPVPTLVDTKAFAGGWKASLYEIPDLSDIYIDPTRKHYLKHFHLRPFGMKKAKDLSADATIYIQAMVFHPEKDTKVEVVSPYIDGNDDGTFRPNDYLTRAQACAIVCNATGNAAAKDYMGDTSFSDTEKGTWYYGYVAYCEKMGLLGMFGEEFEPDKYIASDEFIAMILRTRMMVTDNAKIPSGSGTLNLTNTGYITRERAVAFVNSVVGNNINISGLGVDSPFSDVSEAVWSYNDIVLASTSLALMKEAGSTQYQYIYEPEKLDIIDESLYMLGEEKLRETEELESRRIYEIRDHQSTVNVTGTIYYFSEYGNDSNNGLTPESPKRSLSQIAMLPLEAGDAVLFKRGETFRGNIIAVKGVTYSSYGDFGDKPVLTASPANFAGKNNWEETDTPNVWKLKTPIKHDVGLVVFNDGEVWSEKRIKGREDFPTGDLADLDKDLTIWHDVPQPTEVEGYLYLRSDEGNPGTRFNSIEVAPRNHIVKAADDIVIDNLCFKYTGAHGVSAGSIRNLTVKNCEFAFIGGSWFRTDTLSRFGNAVEVYGACDGYVVDNCYITQIYDAGVTHQLSQTPEKECIMKDIKYTNNVITDTSYPIEYFINTPNEGVEHKIVNCEISGNIIMRTGMGFGDQRPDKTAATAIKGWNTYNEAYNYTITNNIFAVSKYHMMATGAYADEWTPVCDSNTYIQYHRGNFGTIRLGTHSEFNSGIAEFITETSGDENVKVYYLKPVEEETNS